MRSLVLVGLGLGMLVATTVTADLLPLNAITNGSFDTGLAGWVDLIPCPVHPQWAAVGATPLGGAALVPEGQPWCYIGQTLGAPLAEVTLVSWSAKIAPTPGADTGQGMGLYPNAGTRLLNVDLWTDRILFTAFGSATEIVPRPGLAGAWHRYDVLLVGPLNMGLLFVDGALNATVEGVPTPPPDYLWFGDGANTHSRTASPDVTWDEFYVGPAP